MVSEKSFVALCPTSLQVKVAGYLEEPAVYQAGHDLIVAGVYLVDVRRLNSSM
jgi:hypothetical protein